MQIYDYARKIGGYFPKYGRRHVTKAVTIFFSEWILRVLIQFSIYGVNMFFQGLYTFIGVI